MSLASEFTSESQQFVETAATHLATIYQKYPDDKFMTPKYQRLLQRKDKFLKLAGMNSLPMS